MQHSVMQHSADGAPVGGRQVVSITISCDTCVMRETSACDDCIVPMLCGEPEAVIFDYEELRTLAALATAGLTPGLRHQRSA